MKDITFEHDQLNRADPAPDWRGEIPFDGSVLPAEPDPACPPTKTELEAAAIFDAVLAETGDVFAADAALVARLRLDGRAEAVLDACNEDLISVQQAADAMRELDGDGALPLEPDKSSGIMWKR